MLTLSVPAMLKKAGAQQAASTTTTAEDAAAGGWGAWLVAGAGGATVRHAAIQAASPWPITSPNPSTCPPAPPASATERNCS